MALANTGPLSLSDIQTEFGGSDPISLSEYYAAATGVPASGTISISDFYGTSAAFIGLDPSYYLEVFKVSPEGSVSAIFSLESDGDIVFYNDGAPLDLGDWVSPKSAAPGPYSVRVVVTSGTLDAGNTNVWESLTISREWNITQTGIGIRSVIFELSISDDGGTTVLDTTEVTMQVTNDSGL